LLKNEKEKEKKRNLKVIGEEGDENGDVKTRRSDLENQIEKKMKQR